MAFSRLRSRSIRGPLSWPHQGILRAVGGSQTPSRAPIGEACHQRFPAADATTRREGSRQSGHGNIDGRSAGVPWGKLFRKLPKYPKMTDDLQPDEMFVSLKQNAADANDQLVWPAASWQAICHGGAVRWCIPTMFGGD